MATSLSLPINSFSAPQQATDRVVTFQQILADYDSGWLLIPEHQRAPDAWDLGKQDAYVERLRGAVDGRQPSGLFATYQIVDGRNHPSPVYLSDGFQRLTTLRRLVASPSDFDMSPNDVTHLLRLNTTVSHRHYPSHEYAMRDFQLQNNGTRLTPFELCRGFVVYMPHYDSVWKDFIAELEKAIEKSETRLGSRRRTKKRETEHKRKRHCLALFVRFLSEDREARTYFDVSASDIQKYVDRDETIEQRLCRLLLSKDVQEARRQLELFKQFLESTTAELLVLLRKTLGEGRGIEAGLHRWLLDLRIWVRNAKVPVAQYERFVLRLLQETQGKAQWARQTGDRKEVVTLSLASLGYLPKLANFAEMPDFCQRLSRRKRQNNLQAGFDESHILPFSVHGDGPTTPEPASFNRARGAKPLPVDATATPDEGESSATNGALAL